MLESKYIYHFYVKLYILNMFYVSYIVLVLKSIVKFGVFSAFSSLAFLWYNGKFEKPRNGLFRE
jgi:hypothetical protein